MYIVYKLNFKPYNEIFKYKIYSDSLEIYNKIINSQLMDDFSPNLALIFHLAVIYTIFLIPLKKLFN